MALHPAPRVNGPDAARRPAPCPRPPGPPRERARLAHAGNGNLSSSPGRRPGEGGRGGLANDPRVPTIARLTMEAPDTTTCHRHPQAEAHAVCSQCDARLCGDCWTHTAHGRPWCLAWAITLPEACRVLTAVYAEVQRRKKLLDRYDVVFWADLEEPIRRRERVRPLTVLVDEASSLFIPPDLSKTRLMPSDSPLRIEQEEEAVAAVKQGTHSAAGHGSQQAVAWHSHRPMAGCLRRGSSRGSGVRQEGLAG